MIFNRRNELTELELEIAKFKNITFHDRKDKPYHFKEDELLEIGQQPGGLITLQKIREDERYHLRGKALLIKLCQHPNAYIVIDRFIKYGPTLQKAFSSEAILSFFEENDNDTLASLSFVVEALQDPSIQNSGTITKQLQESKQNKSFGTMLEVACAIAMNSPESKELDLLMFFIKHHLFFMKKFDKDQVIHLFTQERGLENTASLIKNKPVMNKIAGDDLYMIATQRRVSAKNTLDTLGEYYDKLVTSENYEHDHIITCAKRTDSSSVLVSLDEHSAKICRLFPRKEDRSQFKPRTTASLQTILSYYQLLTSAQGLNLSGSALFSLINSNTANTGLKVVFDNNQSVYKHLKAKGYEASHIVRFIQKKPNVIEPVLKTDFSEFKDEEGHVFSQEQICCMTTINGEVLIKALKQHFNYLKNHLHLSISEIYHLISHPQGDQTIDVLVNNYSALKTKGFSHEQIIMIAKARHSKKTTESILTNFDNIKSLGHPEVAYPDIHKSIVTLVLPSHGYEKIETLVTKFQSLQWMGAEGALMAIKFLGKKGINTLSQKRKALHKLGMDDAQIKLITRHSYSLKTIDFLIKKFTFLHEKLKFSLEEIVSISAQQNASSSLDALIKHYRQLKNNLGLTHEEIVEIASQPNAAIRIKNIFEFYNSLLEKGYSHEDIMSVASQRAGASTLEAINKHHAKLIELQFTPEQIIAVGKLYGAAKTIQFIVDNHSKLIRLKDKNNQYVNNENILLIAVQYNAAEMLQLLLEIHPILMELEDSTGKYVDNNQLASITRHRGAAKMMNMLFKSCALSTLSSTEFSQLKRILGPQFSKINALDEQSERYKKIVLNSLEIRQIRTAAPTLSAKLQLDGHAFLTLPAEQGGVSMTHADIVSMLNHDTAWHELDALRTYYQDLTEKGYKNIFTFCQHSSASKDIEFISQYHNRLCLIQDKHQTTLDADGISSIASHWKSRETLQYIWDNHLTFTQPFEESGIELSIAELIAIASYSSGTRNLQALKTHYHELKRLSFTHDEIISIASTEGSFFALESLIKHYEKFTRSTQEQGFGLTHPQIVTILSRNWGGFALVCGVNSYLNPDKTKASAKTKNIIKNILHGDTLHDNSVQLGNIIQETLFQGDADDLFSFLCDQPTDTFHEALAELEQQEATSEPIEEETEDTIDEEQDDELEPEASDDEEEAVTTPSSKPSGINKIGLFAEKRPRDNTSQNNVSESSHKKTKVADKSSRLG